MRQICCNPDGCRTAQLGAEPRVAVLRRHIRRSRVKLQDWRSHFVPVHAGAMVGDPKHLSDLRKIEADVRITCRRCGSEDDWNCNDLERHLVAIGGSTVWSEITRYLQCRRFGCGSPDLRAMPLPFARRPANMPRRIGALDARLVSTAMTILETATRKQKNESAATIEVRLALLVVHRYARDRDAARSFWQRAAKDMPTINDGLHEPLERLKQALVTRGWLAPEIMLERTKIWPWETPAPRGWYASRALPKHEADEADD